ncbi:putative disease resistance protein RGA1 [Silene latifolia]|uniref:putative disease resistance protein RGA1 n=1 Tax=Silene latifolia TaxID=37657 RepID=UPI003D781522
MDIGTLLSVIQTLLAALSCNQLKEAWSIWGYKSHLDELSSIVATVKKVLLDAEAKYDELSQETVLYVQELGDALYDADDLLDEFVTLAKQKQLMEDDKFTKKVRLFFSHYNQIGVAYNMSQGVKKIMHKLDGIASKHSKFGLNLDHKPIRRKRMEETCSYPDTEIIGRAEDVENILGILLDSEIRRDVSFLTIVGMGGLGKTALAQLVYNHEKITQAFPLRLWVSVSDHDQSKLDVKTILAQILESTSGQKYDQYSMEVVVSRVREVLAEGRFLIVLDDLWTESRDELGKLVGHFVGDEGGSLVVITTRSKETAKIVGNGVIYELKGLSDENSWHLFQLMAFEQVLDQASPNRYVDLINIGQDIVRMCANVPLAIRVIGRLLYGQEKGKWLTIQELGVANLREDRNGIKPILKLSYHNLESPLKSCFSYCSLFPKDSKIRKGVMISLWMAQGYVVPLEKGQSIEDAGEEYFSVLLRRCFFQDVQKDIHGEIFSFKLHDLMHDVALEVADKEICPASTSTSGVDKVVRHVSLAGKPYANYSSTATRLRTLLVGPRNSNKVPIDIVQILAKFRCVRTLDLSFLNIKILPASIGKLIHLRYLNLSNNQSLEVLPKSISKLYNLQTLNLDYCESLKELPKDLSKLINLRVLGLDLCTRLACMPWGMGNLTHLYKLSKFVVGAGNSSLNQHIELGGLKTLQKLRWMIEIVIHFPRSDAFVKDHAVKEEAYIRDKEHLHTITFECKHEDSDEKLADYEEELLGALQPHANLKVLYLVRYRGATMPRWAAGDNLAAFLPNLVRLDLWNCSQLQCLSSLGKLRYLKSLTLNKLSNLEYMESHSAMSGIEVLEFWPCLETLVLWFLPKLKEWWGPSGETVRNDNSISSNDEPHQSSLFLPELKTLDIHKCPDLTSLFNCPKLKDLSLWKFNERLRMTTTPTSPKLRRVSIDNVAWLQYSLPIESFQSLASLALSCNNDVEVLTDLREVFCACSSSLQTLNIKWFSKLRRIFGGLGYLSVLERLTLHNLPMLNLADEEIDGEDESERVPWGPVCNTLQRLQILNCEELQSFPKWMRKLTSLRQLKVATFSEGLYEKCQNPTGKDWPNIQHIPHISITPYLLKPKHHL